LLKSEPRYRVGPRRQAAPVLCRRQPILADPAFDKTLVLRLSSRHNLGDGATAVGDDDGVAGGSQRKYSLNLFFKIFRSTLCIVAK
jgi:hypothetical protein